MASKIIIQLKGGLVQDAFIRGRGKPDSAIIVDQDIDGIERAELIADSEGEVYVQDHTIEQLPAECWLSRIVKKYLQNNRDKAWVEKIEEQINPK